MQDLFEKLYADFNARRIDAVLAVLSPEVDWPNGWEGGRLTGRAAVRDYWVRQWQAINPHVTPTHIDDHGDGSVSVRVHQRVLDPGGAIVFDGEIEHRYQVEGGLITRMDIFG